MNIDLLKKFVRLANNNPNEHEANSAARRVCKMLAEDEFKCLNSQPVVQPKQPSNPQPTQKTASDYWKSRRPFEGFDWSTIDFNAPFNNFYEKYKDPEYKPKEPRKVKEKQVLKCRTCGEGVLTAFVGPPQMFQCTRCIWNDWNNAHP